MQIRCGGFVLLAVLGCSAAETPLAPVSGRVTYRGQPLTGGTIVFTPDRERGSRGPQAWGEIGPDGGFRVTTDHRPGAVPGWHRITVAALPVLRAPGEPAGLSLPARYRDPDLSGQCREIKAAQTNYLDLQLE